MKEEEKEKKLKKKEGNCFEINNFFLFYFRGRGREVERMPYVKDEQIFLKGDACASAQYRNLTRKRGTVE